MKFVFRSWQTVAVATGLIGLGWAPLARGWNHIEGLVSPSNPLSKIDPSVKTIPVSSIRIDVYVPVVSVPGGQGSWVGKIFLDDVSW